MRSMDIARTYGADIVSNRATLHNPTTIGKTNRLYRENSRCALV